MAESGAQPAAAAFCPRSDARPDPAAGAVLGPLSASGHASGGVEASRLGGAGPVSASPAPPPPPGTAPPPAERQLLTLINLYRTSKGKPALELSQTLDAAARHFSRDMALNNYFPHNYIDRLGDGPDDRMRKHGYPFS